MNILVVDSDRMISKQIAQKIKQWGHHVEKCTTGKQALVMIKDKFFDLVLLELFFR